MSFMTPAGNRSSLLPEKRINVTQGTTRVTSDSAVVLTTVLGSCVAACLFDGIAGVGGMNHFLLSEPREGDLSFGAQSERYGAYAMELLINEMLKAGAVRRRMKAYLYGGANMHAGMHKIGSANARFAIGFLARDGIPLTYSNLGGNAARRVDFRAVKGQARCRVLTDQPPDESKTTPTLAASLGDVELF
ncbi:chemotaxis protein CheD [Rhizorhapis sp. SPR117]|uniref:chemotaxis protein CheD n=1 Tax=Rhizorhapis sp. SPR117 TaxID=2912611 RepID=UPI001F3751CF|nr:chemotaxis protein CheD [Rhizorhapis sp. SPR117]